MNNKIFLLGLIISSFVANSQQVVTSCRTTNPETGGSSDQSPCTSSNILGGGSTANFCVYGSSDRGSGYACANSCACGTTTFGSYSINVESMRCCVSNNCNSIEPTINPNYSSGCSSVPQTSSTRSSSPSAPLTRTTSGANSQQAVTNCHITSTNPQTGSSNQRPCTLSNILGGGSTAYYCVYGNWSSDSSNGAGYACAASCTCGYTTFNSTSVYIESLSCCGSDNCNSLGESGDYATKCNRALPSGSSISFALLITTTFFILNILRF